VQNTGAATHASTKLRACEALISLAIKLHELVEVIPRMAAIETRVAELSNGEQQGAV
jgi:hypothetical protein